ncbi:hypothetical protein [Paracoccus fontiphilus]|uniref:Uncharacterized protein n=1 Tax=Paracoccus fontiphilus TaxID=1815556 RepID=A0ABV7IKC4_9RHOB|nr:hypothetical protein [Paracoccus fontiphilus]
MIKTIIPIFILKTRSFWLGILPLLLTGIDTLLSGVAAGGDGGPFVHMVAQILGYDPAAIRGFLLAITPVWGLILAQQRGGFGGGIPRHYTLDPKKERQIIEAVENGKTVFEAGQKAGQVFKTQLR